MDLLLKALGIKKSDMVPANAPQPMPTPTKGVSPQRAIQVTPLGNGSYAVNAQPQQPYPNAGFGLSPGAQKSVADLVNALFGK